MPNKKKPVKIVLISNFNIAATKRKGSNAANELTIIDGDKRPRFDYLTDDKSDSDLLDPPRDLSVGSGAKVLPNRSDAPVRPLDQSRLIPPKKIVASEHDDNDSSKCSSSSSSSEDGDDDDENDDGHDENSFKKTPTPSSSAPNKTPGKQFLTETSAEPEKLSLNSVKPKTQDDKSNKQDDQSILQARRNQIISEQPKDSGRSPLHRYKDPNEQSKISPIARDPTRPGPMREKPKTFSDLDNIRITIPANTPRVPPDMPGPRPGMMRYRPQHSLPMPDNPYNASKQPNRRPYFNPNLISEACDPDVTEVTHIIDKNASIGAERPFMTLYDGELNPVRNSTRIDKPEDQNLGRFADQDSETAPTINSAIFIPARENNPPTPRHMSPGLSTINEVPSTPLHHTDSTAAVKHPHMISQSRLIGEDVSNSSGNDNRHVSVLEPSVRQGPSLRRGSTSPIPTTAAELLPQPVNRSPMPRSPGINNFQDHLVVIERNADSVDRNRQASHSDRDLKDKFDGALFGLMVGDAIGRENILMEGFPGIPELINDLMDMNGRQKPDARGPLQGSYITGFCSAYSRSLVGKRNVDPSALMHEMVKLKCRPASDNMTKLLNALQAVSVNAISSRRDMYKPALNDDLKDSTAAASIVPLALFTINKSAEEEVLAVAMLAAKLTQADYSSVFGVVLQCFALRKVLGSKTEDYSNDRSAYVHSFFEELIECAVLLEELLVSGQIFDGEYQLPRELENYWNNEANKFKLEQLPQDQGSFKNRLTELYEEMKKCENNNNHRINRRIFCARNYKTANSTLDSVTLAIMVFAIAANPKCNSEVSSKLGVNDAFAQLRLIERAYLYGISFGNDCRYVAAMAAALAGALCGSKETFMPRLYQLCANYKDMKDLSKQLHETVQANH